MISSSYMENLFFFPMQPAAVHWNVFDDGDIVSLFLCIRPLRSRVLTKPSNLSKRSNTPTIGRASRHAV
jgi:hypothetical protein